MLTRLQADGFALFQHLEVAFGSGLNVLTGETGAGKSILLDAIQGVVGGPVDAEQVRMGADKASLEAAFSLGDMPSGALKSLLDEQELSESDGQFLMLAREVRREGRSSGRVNGRLVNQALLRQIGGFLVDIHGQTEHLSLLNPKTHIGLLDRFAGVDDLLLAYQGAYHRLTGMRRELARLHEDEREAARQTDLLSYELEEIRGAQLQTGEEEELRRERDRLANAEDLAENVRAALSYLAGEGRQEPGLTDALGDLEEVLRASARMDSSLAGYVEQVQAALEGMSDLERALQGYAEGIEFNPRRLDEVEERLDLIQRLKRKYGGSIEAVLRFAADAEGRLEGLTHVDERIAQLEAEQEALAAELGETAARLSGARKAAAGDLETAVEAELADLRMEGASFRVSLEMQESEDGLPLPDGRKVAFDMNGIDRAEFLIAPNPGEGLRPLAKIASGGETSRLMLAIKTVLSQADPIPTLIFDEIDQGIGGRAGTMVGLKLWQLGRRHQVLCVTHLPQLAACADRHFRVRKEVSGGRTETVVEELTPEERIQELALMMGADSPANRRAAEELLAGARQSQATVQARA